MKNNRPLHWSFDYNHGAQKPAFAQELIRLLHMYDTKPAHINTDATEGHAIHVYQILPNFWHGYIDRNNPEESLRIGKVIIERQKDKGNIWNYKVQYQNSTNGEDLKMQFQCGDDCFRTLNSSWNMRVTNSGQDTYSILEWEGSISKDLEIQQRINNAKISIGKVNNSTPLTCNWTLFDVIPLVADTMKEKGEIVDISLLDDLDQFRPKCKIGYLDSIESPLSLDGYYLYGTGVLPSYWWIDGNGNLVVVSSFFETLVLLECTGSIS